MLLDFHHIVRLQFDCIVSRGGHIDKSMKMKLLQSVREYFKNIGISYSNRRDLPINWINLVYFIAFTQIILSRGAFIVLEAKTAIEFGLAFYTFVCGLATTAAVSIIIWKNENMFNILQNLEKFVEKSK